MPIEDLAKTTPGETVSVWMGTDGTAYTEVTGINSVELNEISREQVDITHTGSSKVTRRPSLIPDEGTVSLEFLFDSNSTNTNHHLIRATSPIVYYWEVRFFDHDSTGTDDYAFEAWVGNCTLTGGANNENLVANATLVVV